MHIPLTSSGFSAMKFSRSSFVFKNLLLSNNNLIWLKKSSKLLSSFSPKDFSKNLTISVSGITPWNAFTTWLSLNAKTAGIDCILNWAAICWLSSIFILANTAFPLDPFITFSKVGPSCLHGPHHGAQKSTTTNLFKLSSRTFFSKSISLTSLMLLLSICF